MKTLIQSVLLFVAIIGSYALYQNWVYHNGLPEATDTGPNYEGAHIMPDGTVMAGDGEALLNAAVTADGKIMLSNGETLEPTFDLRESESKPKPAETADGEDSATETTGDGSQVQENTDGTHIMPNGEVMTGAGVVLPDAVILADGNIQLSDGTIIEPAFDLRKKDESETEPEPEPVVIDLDGYNFAYSIEEIIVKQGDTVTINFTSTGGFHDWVVDEFEAKTARVDEGESTSVTFVANKTGIFEYYCSVSGHREKGQVGTLIVK